jgi:hypothetical protein
MSVKHRVLFIIPAVLAASWVAVRSVAASPPAGLDEDPPLTASLTVSREIPDPALAQLISRFAAEARAAR